MNFKWDEHHFEISEGARKIVNLPEGFMNFVYGDVTNKAQASNCFDMMREFPKYRDRAFLVHGESKTGKSALASCMIRQLAAARRAWGFYISMPLLLKYKIQDTPINLEYNQTFWDECLETDLLCVDNIGFEDYSSHQAIMMLLQLMKERMDNNRMSFFFTSLTSVAFEKRYGSQMGSAFTTRVIEIDL